MKVVISTDGCFELDYLIIKRYFELSNMGKPYFYQRVTYDISLSMSNSRYQLVSVPSDDLFLVSKSCLGNICDSDMLFGCDYFDYMEIPRDDLNLVKAVEESNSKSLKAIDIPDDIEYYIYELENGREVIHEEHRTWS